MPTIKLTLVELEAMLQEQVNFLVASCAAFDGGFEGEIKRLAVTTRVLVHDTANSTSLLTLLDRKAIAFVDTALPFEERSLLSHSSLVQYHHTLRGTTPKAHLDGGIRIENVSFDAWWNGIVFVDKRGNEFSRKDIVLNLANKEGGAHVDERIDEQYSNLRKSNALGWSDLHDDGRVVPGVDQVPATMRQIAHELLKTLSPGYSCVHPESAETQLISMGATVHEGSQVLAVPGRNLRKSRPVVNGVKIGRNDPCVCGSGKKYKHCCI